MERITNEEPAPTSFTSAAMKVELVAPRALRPYAGNARVNSNKQIRQIAGSIWRFGFTNPVLVSDEGEIIAGHGRVMAARELGLSEVLTIRLSYLSADDHRGLYGRDQPSGGRREEKELQESAPEGEVPGVPDHTVSRRGDLWQLESLRLLCGDAQVASDVAAVLRGDPSMQALLCIAQQTLRIKEAGEIQDVPAYEAVLKAQIATTSRGSAYAQDTLLTRLERIEERKARKLAEERAIFERHREVCNKESTDALKNKLDIPRFIPHPDDIIIEPRQPVRIAGPRSEDEATRVECHAARLDHLICRPRSNRSA